MFNSITILLGLLGFCWRFVCLRRLEPKRGLKAKLIEEMKDYLVEQGLADDCPADNTLREIADLVVEQLADRNLSASLFKARSLKVLAAQGVSN